MALDGKIPLFFAPPGYFAKKGERQWHKSIHVIRFWSISAKWPDERCARAFNLYKILSKSYSRIQISGKNTRTSSLSNGSRPTTKISPPLRRRSTSRLTKMAPMRPQPAATPVQTAPTPPKATKKTMKTLTMTTSTLEISFNFSAHLWIDFRISSLVSQKIQIPLYIL